MKFAYRLVLGAAVLIGACSGQADTNSNAPASRSTPTPSQAEANSPAPSEPQSRRVDPRRGGLEVGFGEFAVTLEAKTIRPGEVTFVIRNGGRVTHGFELESENEDESGGDDSSGPGSGSDDRFKIESEAFGPGETVRMSANLVPGTYKIYCYVADHEERGMRTLLRVRENAPLVRAAAASANAVEIKGFAFVPATIEVTRGTTVRWTNSDPTEHTVTSREQSFGSDPLASGQTFTTRFNEAGTFRYFCAIHPAMEGTVRVG
ncbi:MAG TPA: plastocyanin/azurin family copper-binding protein [Actinomycetota bacterium]|nr:plastocyanin/azurin family copper-binding protein [Actinomycetota bacterium]